MYYMDNTQTLSFSTPEFRVSETQPLLKKEEIIILVRKKRGNKEVKTNKAKTEKLEKNREKLEKKERAKTEKNREKLEKKEHVKTEKNREKLEKRERAKTENKKRVKTIGEVMSPIHETLSSATPPRLQKWNRQSFIFSSSSLSSCFFSSF